MVKKQKRDTFKKRRRNRMRYSHKMQQQMQRGGIKSTEDIVKELTTTNPELPRIIELSQIMREKMIRAQIDMNQAPEEKGWFNVKKTKDDIIKKNKEYSDAYYLVALKLNEAYIPLLDTTDPNIETEITKNLKTFYDAFGHNLTAEIDILNYQIKKNIDLLDLYKAKQVGTNLDTYILQKEGLTNPKEKEAFLKKNKDKLKIITEEKNTQQKITELNSANEELKKNMENLMKIFTSSKLVYDTTGSGPSLNDNKTQPKLEDTAYLGLDNVVKYNKIVATKKDEEARLKTVNDEEARLKAVNDEEARLKAVNDEDAQLKAVNDEEARSKAANDEDAQLKAVNDEDAQLKAVNNKTPLKATPNPVETIRLGPRSTGLGQNARRVNQGDKKSSQTSANNNKPTEVVNRGETIEELNAQTLANRKTIDDIFGGGQRGGGDELKQALTNLNINLAASISPNLSGTGQTTIPLLKSNERQLAENTQLDLDTEMAIKNSLKESGLSASGYLETDLEKAINLSLSDLQGVTDKQTRELSTLIETLRDKVTTAVAAGTDVTDKSACTGDLDQAQLNKLVSDSYVQIIQYLNLTKQFIGKQNPSNAKIIAKIDAALAALKFTAEDTAEAKAAGINVEQINKLDDKVSGIADIMLSLLGMGVISATAIAGGRKTKKHKKGKKYNIRRRQTAKRSHNKKYRIHLYSKGKR